MAYVSNYTFDKLSRIGDDSCCIDQNTIQNIAQNNYLLQNYFASDCSMKKPIELAVSQPGIFYRGGFNSGAGGCNIDDSSNLQIGSIQTHPRCHVDLFQRPFATVPYLGRGAVNPVVESDILQGELGINRQSVNFTNEANYSSRVFVPLLPEVQRQINNPARSIEDSASHGWVRGGIPCRDLTRDQTLN
jgi:hypothetical protein